MFFFQTKLCVWSGKGILFCFECQIDIYTKKVILSNFINVHFLLIKFYPKDLEEGGNEDQTNHSKEKAELREVRQEVYFLKNLR